MNDEELDYLIENKVYGMGYDTYEEDGHSDYAVEKIIKEFVAPFNKQIKELEKENEELKFKIKKLTQHLEPQLMTALFEQVEEEFKQKQRTEKLEKEIEELKSKIIDMRNQWNKLENDIKDVCDPHARYNIDDLIEDWDIR